MSDYPRFEAQGENACIVFDDYETMDAFEDFAVEDHDLLPLVDEGEGPDGEEWTLLFRGLSVADLKRLFAAFDGDGEG